MLLRCLFRHCTTILASYWVHTCFLQVSCVLQNNTRMGVARERKSLGMAVDAEANPGGKTFWLWRWLQHRLSKRQSLSTTTVLFRTTFTRTNKLNPLLKWLLGSNLSQNVWCCWQQQVVTFAHASSLLGRTCWREIVMAESRSEALSREIFLHT